MRNVPNKLSFGFEDCSLFVEFLTNEKVVEKEEQRRKENDADSTHRCDKRVVGTVYLKVFFVGIERERVRRRAVAKKGQSSCGREGGCLAIVCIAGIVQISFASDRSFPIYDGIRVNMRLCGQYAIHAAEFIGKDILEDFAPDN
jgi:hypothetical protein